MDNARRHLNGWVGAAVTAALLLAGCTSDDRDEPDQAVPSGPEADACAGVEAQYIDLDLQVVEPQERSCFELDERMSVTVGAAALRPDDAIVLTVRTLDGTELASAASEELWDPEATLTLDPGAYIVEVTGRGGGTPPFLIYTATFPPGEDQPAPASALPPVDDCGGTVPRVADDEPVSLSATEEAAAYACVVVEVPTFLKVGLTSEQPDSADDPDLQLAVYRYADDPLLVRSVDDVIGFDPEMSLDLDPGTYLIEATAWFDAPPGALQVYVDDDADLFRQGTVTSLHADAEAELCADAPLVTPGDAMTVEGERTYLCLETDRDRRLVIEAATLTDQDLVLEVIGFDDSGAPYRLAFADGNPYTDVLADFDPLLDQVIPQGTWLVAVTTYYTGTAADYDVRVEPGQPR